MDAVEGLFLPTKASGSDWEADYEAVRIGVLLQDDDGASVFTNHEFDRLFSHGLGGEAHGETVARLQDTMVSLRRSGVARLGVVVPLPDGRVLEQDYFPLTIANFPARHLYLLRDMSEKRREGDRLRLMEAVALHAKDVVLVSEAEPIDFPGPRVVYVNPAFSEMTGYAPGEIIGKNPRLLQGPRTNRATLRFIRQKLAAWEPLTADLQNYRKDGTPFWVEISVQPVANRDGFYTHWIAIQRDITHRKEIEEQLAFQARSLAQVSDAVIGFDADTRAIYWNHAAESLFGESAASVMGTLLLSRPAFDWLRHSETQSGLWATLETADAWGGEVEATLTPGRSVPLEISVSRLSDADQNPAGFLAIIRDISDRKRAEAERQELYNQQRRFVKEVMRSVTANKLELCETRNELPGQLPTVQSFTVREAADLSGIRRATVRLAESHNHSPERVGDLVSAVGEAAMNTLFHASGGTVDLCADAVSGDIQVWIQDEGHGISHDYLHRATLERGFTTGGSLGHGFKIILSTVDKLHLLTGAQGTLVVISQAQSEADPLKSVGLFHMLP